MKPAATMGIRYQSVNIDCYVLGMPSPESVWFKDGIEFTNRSSSHQVLSNGTLHFFRVQLNDSGNYHCIGHNEHGSITSNPPVRLHVICKYYQRLTFPVLIPDEEKKLS